MTFFKESSQERVEDVYASTFDSNPASYPYAGYHVFGEDPRRGELMDDLQRAFRSHGFQLDRELPDHVGVLFQFLGHTHGKRIRPISTGYGAGLDAGFVGSGEFEVPSINADLSVDLHDGLLKPTLEKLTTSLTNGSPYRSLLQCALCVLKQSEEC